MHPIIILGSGSPRRRELLQTIWPGPISMVSSDIDETYPSDLPLSDIPSFLSKLKGEALKDHLIASSHILITADTVVIHEGEVLGKPHDLHAAKTMLERLSDSRHEVITGVSIYTLEKEIHFAEKTEVFFAALKGEDMEYYLSHHPPLDKAGSYGIQEFIGMIGVKKIIGCYYNIMGLPTYSLHQHLRNL